MAAHRINGKDARFTIKDADGNVVLEGKLTGWSETLEGELEPPKDMLEEGKENHDHPTL